ncbi:MAG: hypothetical protein NC131_03855 [Roseburia sp.]|nr:hypothetical protein [Roseburia sp.]
MNKKLKIATAAVSVVMAGTMAFGMFGCSKGSGTNNGKQEKLDVAAATESLSDVTLNINIGDAAQRSISYKYGDLLSGNVKLPDGNTYSSSSLKPAWKAFETELGVKFNDVWQNSSNKVTNAITATTNGSRLSDMDIVTAGNSEINDNSSNMLDLSNYLDEMPNYKAFLDANDIVRLSLTSNTTTGAMYSAPYFDGNNDIEKYELFKTNWVKALLDNTTGGDTTTTYKSHGAVKVSNGGKYAGTLTTSTAIESFMGKKGSYTTDVLLANGTKGKITVNYDKALAAAKDDSTGLGDAIKQAADAVYSAESEDKESGNIVDLMNYVINKKAGEVTGAKLLKILQEYIKVTYYEGDSTSTTQFYGRTGYALSDVFVGSTAAWDVDLYAALGRVLVTNPSLLKSGSAGSNIGGTDATPLKNLYLLSARQNNMQRMIDTVSMIGQLYGVRGLESKNLYTYIGADGKVHDPRGEEASYEAMAKFNAFWQEGLIYEGASGSNADQSYFKKDTPEALSCYDYVNTQTPAGFKVSGQVTDSKYAIEEGYDYTPIINPVSKWDEDGSDAIEADEYFRFTESWRTTKDTGFCVPLASVKGNPKKLRAVLNFIDKMFSHDGQILLTYGPKATKNSDGTYTGGFWYNEPATNAEITAGTYFTYKGEKLSSMGGDKYAGEYQPKILDSVMDAYIGKTVNGFCFDGSTGVEYAGGDTKYVPTDDDKSSPTGNWNLEHDTYEVNKNGDFVKVAQGTQLGKGTYYIVKAEIAANTDAEGEAYYFVTDKGYLASRSCKRVALVKSGADQWVTGATLNYTNFARYVIGSALPIGNKLQSFEFQLTSAMGRRGALVVDAAREAGVIKTTENVITSNPWYTVVPTVLPYTKAETTSLGSTYVRLHDSKADKYFTNNKDAKTNLYWIIIENGYSCSAITAVYDGLGVGSTGTTSATEIMGKLESVDGFTAYLNIKKGAWEKSQKYFKTLSAD